MFGPARINQRMAPLDALTIARPPPFVVLAERVDSLASRSFGRVYLARVWRWRRFQYSCRVFWRRLRILLLAGPVAWILWSAWVRRWLTDDGFIYVRVVNQILDGNGPVFNAGERVEAAT